MKLKRTAVGLVVVMVLSLMGAYGVDSVAAGMKLNKSKLKLTIGETFKLKVKKVGKKKVKWKSTKKTVATVSKKGKVKAKNKGKTRIIAKVGKKKLVCKVTVKANYEDPESTSDPNATLDPTVTTDPVATIDPSATETPVAIQTPVSTQTPAPTVSPVASQKPSGTASPTPVQKKPFDELKEKITKKGTDQTVDGIAAKVLRQDITSMGYGILNTMYFYSSLTYFSQDVNGEESILMQYSVDYSDSSAFDINTDYVLFVTVRITAKDEKKCSVSVVKYEPSNTSLPIAHGKVEGVLRTAISNDNYLSWNIEEVQPSMPDYSKMIVWAENSMNGSLDKWYADLNNYLVNSVDMSLSKLGFGK